MTDEEQQVVETKQEKVQDRTKLLRILGIIFSITFSIILGFVAYYKEDFPIGWIIVSIFLIVFFWAATWFGMNIYTKVKNIKESEDKIPKPKSIPEVIVFAQNLVMNKEFADMIPYNNGRSQNHTVGKKNTLVYEYSAKGVLTGLHYEILINRHTLDYTILVNSPRADVIKAINMLALEPEEPADEEKTTSENLLTGTKITTEKKSHKKKEEKKELKEGEIK